MTMPAAKRAAGLAKLSRPRLYDAVPRERLFTLLDAQADQGVVLVAAPPGAGKTTLVASYLESRGLGGIWYQVDAGDADPSTFFYFLGLAERALQRRSRKPPPLPLLTPEYLADLPGFSRRFFRELFARVPAGTTLVFDNFQEAGDESALHAALVAGLEEVPHGMRVFLISRFPPPDRYARLAANRAMGLVDWEQIKLTADETREVLHAARLMVDEQTAEALHARSCGWTAGLVLLAEHLRRGRTLVEQNDPDSLTQVFAYFAGQLFDQASDEERRMLMTLSFLPSVSERHAHALTERPEATALLERLYRRHLFTDRRRGDQFIYTFHALFRAFLQHRAQAELSAQAYRQVAGRAARLLADEGQPEGAMPLFLLAEDYDAAEALMRAAAPALIAQGRWKVVVEWAGSLHKERLAASAWLLHWLGTAQIGVDPQHARSVLEQAYLRAADQRDVDCQVQVAAGMVEAYFLEYSVFTPLDRWIPVLEQMFLPGFRFATLDSELRAQSALLISTTYRQPDHPRIERSAARVQELLHSPADINLRVSAGTHLCIYGAFTGHLEESRRAAHLVAPLLDETAVTIFRKIFAWAVIEWYACNTSDELGARANAANEMIARNDGVHVAERFACILGFYREMDQQAVQAARLRLERFEQIMIASQPYELASLVNMRSWWGVYTNDCAHTLRHGPEAVRLYEHAGSIPHIMVGLNGMVWGYVEAGDTAAALRCIAEHRAWSERRNLEWSRWAADAGEAILALRAGDEDTLRERLQRIFAQERGRMDQYGHQLAWARGWSATLAAEALRRNIQPACVRRFVREYGLKAPSHDLDAWPWPVRIVTLGRFELQVDAAPVAFAGKAPKKVLALLKAIICFGGAEVKDYQLADALWPDEEGDAARDAQRVALHRLRKLLGQPDAVLVEEGRISLNREVCWVDAFAFEALLDGARNTGRDLDAQQQHALALYRGALLPADRDEPWTAPMRERLRTKFMHYFARLGSMLEARQAWDEALDLYVRGLDADNATESFYQGLMRCHAALGRPGDAASAYRQLRETLAATLGVKPSPASEALYQTLREAPRPAAGAEPRNR
jgi:DNA-binding SARP family transcriptional activator